MLSGGAVVQFREPFRGKGRYKWKHQLTLKGTVTVFPTLTIFWGFRLDPLPVFDGTTIIHLRDPKIKAMPGIIPHTVYLNDLMVAYLTNAMCWVQ